MAAAAALAKLQAVDGDDHEEDEPMSPTGRYLNSSALSVAILVAFELEVPMNEASTIAAVETMFLPMSPRFSSIMVRDDGGVLRWKKVKVRLEEHVFVPAFPEGHELYDELVKGYVTAMAAEPLPPGRPPWQIHLIKYPTRGAASTAVFKLHHALGDGFTLMGALLSCVRRTDDPSLPLTLPSATSGSERKKQQEMAPAPLRQWVSMGMNSLKDFGWSFLKSNLLKDDESPVRSGTPGVEFRPIYISAVTFELEDIKKIKGRLGGTVNDVVTGIIFYGTRLYIQAKGGGAGRPEEVTALVLLNTRMAAGYRTIEEMRKNEDGKAPWGNRFRFLHVPVPDASGPLEFVREARKTIMAKRSSLGAALNGNVLDLTRKLLGSDVAAMYMSKTQRNTSMTISNLIGPLEKTLGGHPVKNFHFMITGSPQSLTVTAVSYNGKLRVAVGVEKGFIDTDLLLSCFSKAFQKIYLASGAGLGAPEVA